MTTSAPTPAAPILKNPMRRGVRVTWCFFYLALAMLLIGLIRLGMVDHAAALHPTTQPSDGDLISILGITWGAIGVPVTFWLVWMYRRLARRAADILSGANRLAQWTCTPEEWERHRQTIKQRSKKAQRTILLILGISGVLIVGVMFAAAFNNGSPPTLGLIATLLGIAIGTLLLIYLIAWFGTVYLPERHVRNPASRDVFIGTGGLVSAGKFQSWQVMGASIKFVRYEPADPGTLLFCWSQPGMGGYAYSGPTECLVPVPKAADADARRVVEFFSKQFHQ